MESLWSAPGPQTVRQVLGTLDRDPEPAYTTVMTVLDNLYRKDMTTRERQGRAWAYRPAQSRAEYDASRMAEVLDSSSDKEAVFLKFVDSISTDEIAQLRTLLDETGRSE